MSYILKKQLNKDIMILTTSKVPAFLHNNAMIS